MPNSYDLIDKVALITGGAKGIGRAIVTRLVASGAKVRVWDAAPTHIAGAETDVVDITQAAEIAAALSRFADAARIDLLINDAGYLGTVQSFDLHPSEDWQRIIATNLLGTMQVTQAVLPYMIRSGGGRIVNMASMAAKLGTPGEAHYAASKAAVVGLTRVAAKELAVHGITVNCVCPGYVLTEMGAVTRRGETTAAGHSVTTVPNSSSTPPAQIQLTSGFTNSATEIFAVGPSPSQPPRTTYRSSNGVDRNPTRVLGCCGKLSKYCLAGRKSSPSTLSTPSMTFTPGIGFVSMPCAVTV